MTIAGRLPGGYTERNLKTDSGIRMCGRDTVPIDDCEGGETRQFALHSIKAKTVFEFGQRIHFLIKVFSAESIYA